MSEISEQAVINAAVRLHGPWIVELCDDVKGKEEYDVSFAHSEEGRVYVPLAEALAEQAKLDAAKEIEVTGDLVCTAYDAALRSEHCYVDCSDGSLRITNGIEVFRDIVKGVLTDLVARKRSFEKATAAFKESASVTAKFDALVRENEDLKSVIKTYKDIVQTMYSCPECVAKVLKRLLSFGHACEIDDGT
jgi:hypothetical protein